jgi:SAM-dependent methyltransferase
LVEGRSVLEFGPGSGHNSIYTASLNPSTYDLVDANPTGLKSTSSMLSKYEDIELKVHESLFLDFKSEKKFDIVWAENCIPGQANPIEVLDYVKNFVQEKGILVSPMGFLYFPKFSEEWFTTSFLKIMTKPLSRPTLSYLFSKIILDILRA